MKNLNNPILKKTNKKILMLILTFSLINLSLTEFPLYLNGSVSQEEITIATMMNENFAIFYKCLNLFSSNYYSICYTIRKRDFPETLVKTSYYGAHSTNSLYLPSADTLSDGKIALAYQNNEAGILLVFNQDFTIFRNDFCFTSLTGTSTNTFILTLKNNKFLLLWKQKDTTTNLSKIYGNIYTNSVVFVKKEFLINDQIAIQDDHSACVMATGDFVIVWAANNVDGINNYSVFMQIFKENGDRSGSLININKDAISYSDRYPHVACLTNGNIAVAWTNIDGKDSDSHGVYTRLFDKSGTPISAENTVNTYVTGVQSRPKIVSLLEGRYAITFHGQGSSTNAKSDTSSYGIYFQLYNSSGNKYSNNFLINDSTLQSQIFPHIKRLNNGSYLAAWESNDQTFSPINTWRCYFKYIAFDNLVNQFHENDQAKPQVAALSNGGYAIVWQSFGEVSLTSDWDIFVKIYSKEKRTEIKSAVVVNTDTEVGQETPKISAFGTGKFIVIWLSNNGCANKRIYGTIFTNDLVRNKEAPLHDCAEPYGLIDNPNVLALPDDRFVVSWSQTGGTDDVDSDVYFQVFDQDFATSIAMTKLNSITSLGQLRNGFAYVIVNSKTTYMAVYDSINSSGSEVYGKIFKSDFSVSKSDFVINNASTGYQNHPYIKGLSNGNFVIGYRSNIIDGDGLGVSAKIYSNSGALVKDEIRINNFIKGNQLLNGLDASSNHIYFYYTGQNNIEMDGVILSKFDYNLVSIWENEPMRYKIGGQQLGGVAVTNLNQVIMVMESNSGDIDGKSVLYEILEVCPDNYYNNSDTKFVCMPCDSSCEGCTTQADLCISCKTEFYRKIDDDQKCYAWNPSSLYYLDTINNNWAFCDVSCNGCMGDAKNCLACSSTYYPLSNDATKCYLTTSAPDGYFWDSVNLKHFPCSVQCAKCITNSSTCTLCNTNYYPLVDNSHDCRQTAPNGYYLDSSTNKHEFCDVSCSTCVDLAKKCKTCKSGYYFLEDKPNCFNTDQIGYFFNSIDKYLKCDVSCYTCSGSRTYCTKCAANYFPIELNQNDCRNSANYPDGTYLESTISMYRVCDVSCALCIDSEKKCTKCATDYYILEDKVNTCIIKNSNLYYFSIEINKGYYLDNPITKYFLCDISCLNCVGTANHCVTCNNALNYYPLRDKLNTCVNAPPVGYFFDPATKHYELCDVSCYTCIDSASYCTKCNTAGNYSKLEDKPNICKNYAPDGYYFDNQVKYYKLCDVSCFTCIDVADKCTKCNLNYYFLEDVSYKCMNYALPNYYLERAVSPYLYKRCAISCELCIDRADKCTKCNYDKVYFPLETDSFSCFNECPDYFWKNFLKLECSLCHISCKKCNDNSPSCIVCADNYFPASDRPSACYNITPHETYTFDWIIKNWYKCPEPGYICNEDKSYKICMDGFYLLPTTKACLKTCPDGFWQDTPEKLCRPCVAPCQKCVNNKTCLSCISNHFVMEEYPENNCLLNCPLSYYADRNTGFCKKCNPACLSCESDKICNSCNKGFVFFRENRECVSKCPVGFYLPPESEMCLKCSSLCRTCEQRSENCTSCNYSRFFDPKSKTCVLKCPSEFYPEIKNNTCNYCHKTCLTCKGALENNCLTCDLTTGVRFIKGYCTDKCPVGMIKKKNSDDCIDFNACIDKLFFNVPKIFNIQINNYKANLLYKLRDNCNEYLNDILVSWLLSPDIILSADNLSVEIPVDKLKDGNLNMYAEMSYNGSIIRSFTASSLLITNKLIPLIKNESKLEFVYGFEILIDASLSYDEGSLRSNSKEAENPLIFKWICQEEISVLCKTTNSILVFNPTDYQSLIPNTNENISIEITLNLKRDRRTASKTFTIVIKNLQKDNEGQTKNINFADLILINPLSRGAANEIIFEVSYLDKNLNVLDFTYFWIVRHFNKDIQYINSRKEINLKVLNEDLLTGDNLIMIEVTDKTGKTYSKSYTYEKGKAPYGGNCVVSPNSGISMKTDFKFTLSGWISTSEPLIYKIKYLNSEKIFIDISKGGFSDSTWQTNMVPAADKFVVEIIDASGKSTTAPCSLKVKSNSELEPLETYLEKDFDPINRLLIVDIYKSNKKRDSESDLSINDKALDMIGYYLSNPGDDIQLELENIIAKLLEISNQNFTKEKLEIVNNTIQTILENIEPLLEYIEKMQNVYRILDNIFMKASETNELKENKLILKKMQDFLDLLDEKLFKNAVNGQAILIQNQNYNTQMNKVSSLNVPDLAVSYDSEGKKRKNKKTKIRILQNNNSDNNNQCDESAAICIPKNNITSIMSNTASKGVGFQSQLNHKLNLPIEENQFSNSLNFDISGEDKSGKLRNLNSNEFAIQFEIRLKMPVVKDSSIIGEATCVQYKSGKNADTSCESWYDISTNEVVCSCFKQGLTVNVLDKALSSASKLKQFPTLSSDLFNPYSVGIVGGLILLFLFIFLIAIRKDKKDSISLFSLRSANYDIIQHYIIKFRKEKFKRNLEFFKLFFYLIKNLHPIVSILNIYDPVYNRKIRVMDFFLIIYLSFFFTLLPFYMTDNSQLMELAANRSIQNRNKNVDDLNASIKQIFQSVIYSVIASVITIVITSIINLLHNQNVLLQESIKKRKNMVNAIIRINPSIKALYQIKLKNAYYKIKTVLLVGGKFIRNLRNEESPMLGFSKTPAKFDNSCKANNLLVVEKGLENIKQNELMEYAKYNDNSNVNFINSSSRKDLNNLKLENINVANIFKDINIKNDNQVRKENEENNQLNSEFDIDLDLFKENQIMQLNIENEHISKIEKISTNINFNENSKNKENELTKLKITDTSAKKNVYSNIKKTKGFTNHKMIKRDVFFKDDYKEQENSSLYNLTKYDSLSISTRALNNKNKNSVDNKKGYTNENASLTEESFALSFIGKKEIIPKPKKMIISVCSRTFIFPTRNSSIFECQKITITEPSKFSDIIIFIKSMIKLTIILVMYTFLWFYIAVFVQSIYKQYGKNVFKICVMPLISMLFTNLFIIVNIKLLITTIMLYFKGKDFVNSSKKKFINKLLFTIFVPPVALNHFVAIITFMDVDSLSV